jgi:hypothetical protein
LKVETAAEGSRSCGWNPTPLSQLLQNPASLSAVGKGYCWLVDPVRGLVRQFSIPCLLERRGFQVLDLHLGDAVGFHLFHGIAAAFEFEGVADLRNFL